jgi:hypothetical protein
VWFGPAPLYPADAQKSALHILNVALTVSARVGRGMRGDKLGCGL